MAAKAAMQSRVIRIQAVLDQLYPAPVPVPLNSRNDFTFLCAVVLSAQTTDGKVNHVTQELFRRAAEPSAMVALGVEAIQAIIQPVGLAPQKAKNLWGLSKKIISDFGGEVPTSYEALESLPGVGHKTASVVMSQCFGQPAFAVDTHVHRLALRWGLSKEERNVDKVQLDLCSLFPETTWNKLHLQMIYFGREYCTAKDHKNTDCPICCWIHQPEKNAENVRPLESFSPHKPAKGIVCYAERLAELRETPQLFTLSPKKTAVDTEVVIVESKKEAAEAKDISLASDVLGDLTDEPAIKRPRRSRAKKVAV